MSLRPANYQEALERARRKSKPRQPLKRGKLKVGRKVQEWASVRAKLKLLFEERCLTSCEFFFIAHDCWKDTGLSFAHSHKRTDPDFEMYAVALACPPAHQILDEQMSHAEMATAVHRAIINHGGIIKPDEI